MISVFSLTLVLATAASNSVLRDVVVTVQFLVIVLAIVSYLAAVAKHPGRLQAAAALGL